MNNLKSLEFWFENCEGVTIPVECISNLDYKIEDNKITEFKCNIIDNGKTNYSKTWADNDITPLQRIAKYNDITSIKFTYNDGQSKDYYVLWDSDNDENSPYQKSEMKNFREIDLSIDKTNQTYTISDIFNNFDEETIFIDRNGIEYELKSNDNGQYITDGKNKIFESVINGRFFKID
jgi:hypothetical protein